MTSSSQGSATAVADSSRSRPSLSESVAKAVLEQEIYEKSAWGDLSEAEIESHLGELARANDAAHVGPGGVEVGGG